MKKLITGLLAVYLVSGMAEALLPPLYEGVREIKAIIENEEFDQKLTSGEVVETIQKNETGYEILSNKHRLQVDVKYKVNDRSGPEHNVGPAQFELYFHDPKPI